MVRAYDLEIAGLARVGQAAVRKERATPCSFDLRDLAVDDIARQAKHHVLRVATV